MTAIEQAYASNTESIIPTFEFAHPAFTNGVLYLVQSHYDLEATTEAGTNVTFLKSSISYTYPAKNTEGQQDINIQLDNVSNQVWIEINKVVKYNRANDAVKIKCTVRGYLPSDLTGPSGEIFKLPVVNTAINDRTATIRASYTPIPDVSWPRLRYYPTKYPGTKYT